jgi:hypothetical protein
MKKQRSQCCWIFLSALVLILASCTQTPQSSATPTPTISTKPTNSATLVPVPTTPPLGSIPRDCTPGPTPRSSLPGIGPVIGGSKVWASGFEGSHATILIRPYDDTYTQHGWSWKIVWEVGPDYTQLVTIQGGNLRNGMPLWIQVTGNPATSAVLDPKHPDHPGSSVGIDWAEWGSYVFIPQAGCYYLQASWPGGSWRIDFAAGR